MKLFLFSADPPKLCQMVIQSFNIAYRADTIIKKHFNTVDMPTEGLSILPKDTLTAMGSIKLLTLWLV